MAFWPRPVANVIGAYQARLEQETRGSRPTEEFSWASAAHPVTTPAPPPGPVGNGQRAAGAVGAAGGGPGWPAQPPLQSQSYARPQGYASPQGYPQSQGFPGPQGYSPSQDYPQPQGYSGAQGRPAPPRGYLPNARPANYPQPYQVRRAPAARLPDSMRNAIGLMYAGAAYALVYGIGVIIVAGAIISKHPVRAAAGHVTVGGVAALTVVLSVIEIALWLGIARACRAGQSWARVTGTVLFGLHTLGFLGVLVNSHPGLGLTKVLTALSWLIACGAVVFLWQRPSSAFFQGTAAPGRPA